MSLQIWLPLNGNLNNLGVSNLQFTNETTNITVNPNGKIGSCYERATVKTTGRIVSDNNILLDGDLSMCCWAKVTETVGDTANGLVTNHTPGSNAGFGITVKLVSTTDYRMSCSTGNGSSRTYMTYYGTTNIKGEWHHLALTYDNTNHIFKLFVDGIVECTLSYTNSAISSKVALFNWNLGSTAGTYHPAAMLNDVRIYDHCLSDKEVEEISKGLVLHYKLDSGSSPDSILTTNTTRSATVAAGGTGVYTSYWYVDALYKEAILTNTVLTVEYDYSVNMSTVTATTTYLYSLFNTSTISPQNPVTYTMLQAASSGHKVDTFVVTSSLAAYANSFRLRIRLYQTNEGANFTISNIKMYFGQPSDYNIIYDSSGYNNNGTINGTLTSSSNTARYLLSVYFGAYNTPNIILNTTSLLSALTNCTVTYWGKYDTTKTLALTGDTTSKYIMASNANTFYHSSAGSPTVYKNGVAGTYSCTAGTWDFFVVKNVNLSSWTQMKINSYSSAWPLKGYLSDFRIYATTLTDQLILELYQTSTSIDNKGNIHTRELVEI